MGDQPLRIGGNNAFAGEFFNGLIDEVGIYNRARTASEIAAAAGRDSYAIVWGWLSSASAIGVKHCDADAPFSCCDTCKRAR